MAAAESISDVQLTYNIKATSEYVITTSR